VTRFLKGHGTENDFVLLPEAAELEPGAELSPLSAAQVRGLCDRHAGIGADGVLRVVPVGVATRAQGLVTGAARWFMDYRNADGSVSEMCGNGARLFARFLLDAGLESATEFDLATRGGVHRVSLTPSGEISVDMGPARLGEQSAARIGDQPVPGVQVSMSNPHLVCIIDGAVGDLDLSVAPTVDNALFPHGVNVEFVNLVAGGPEDGTVHVAMRVHERGVGETRSCGTGACAAAVAALAQVGRDSGEVLVDVPGGQVRVSVTPETTVLVGPAVFVASGEIDAGWWASLSAPGSGTADPVPGPEG